MKTWQKVLIGFGVFTVLTTLILFFSYTSASDKEVKLRTNVTANQKSCKSNRDKLHNTLTNMIGVPREFMDKSKEAFMDIYPDLMEGRYGDERGGALMSWVTESNPNFDMSAAKDLYENLQIAIEANFKEFDTKQNALISAWQEHHNHINTWWNKNVWGLDSRGEIEIVILENARVTEEYSNGGKYEGVDLFSKED